MIKTTVKILAVICIGMLIFFSIRAYRSEETRLTFPFDSPVAYDVEIEGTVFTHYNKMPWANSKTSRMHFVASRPKISTNPQSMPHELEIALLSFTDDIENNPSKTTLRLIGAAPVLIHLDQNGIDKGSQLLLSGIENKLLQESKAKAELNPVNVGELLNLILLQPFMIAEKELVIGKMDLSDKINAGFLSNAISDSLKEIVKDQIQSQEAFEIISITNDSVEANLNLFSEINYDENLEAKLQEATSAKRDLNGSNIKIGMKGEGSMTWNRENALLFQAGITYKINIKTFDSSATDPSSVVTIKIKLKIDSKKFA